MDKDEYDKSLMKKVNNGSFYDLGKEQLLESTNCIKKQLRNEEIPRISRYLPKRHKPENETREITDGLNSPIQKLAKWLWTNISWLERKS